MRPINVFANGFPKSGNHALMRACELLGIPAAVNHVPFEGGLPANTTHHLLIKRDPRNILVSWLRFQRKPVTPGAFLASLRRFQSASLKDEMAGYAPWLTHPGTLVVSWEQLVSSDSEMHRMAEFVGIPYIPGSWEDLPGNTMTWNDQHSDYREIWTPLVQSTWEAEGGDTLMKEWGY